MEIGRFDKHTCIPVEYQDIKSIKMGEGTARSGGEREPEDFTHTDINVSEIIVQIH